MEFCPNRHGNTLPGPVLCRWDQLFDKAQQSSVHAIPAHREAVGSGKFQHRRVAGQGVSHEAADAGCRRMATQARQTGARKT